MNNDKLITGRYILDTNGVIPPKVNYSTTINYYGYDHRISIWGSEYVIDNQDLFDENGDLWFFDTHLYYDNRYVLYKVSVDDDGNTVVSDLIEGTLNFTSKSEGDSEQYKTGINERTHIWKDGYIKLQNKAGGGIDVISNPFNGVNGTNWNNSQCRYIQDNYIYWIDGTKIYRTLIEPGNIHEEIYSNSDIVNPATIIGNRNYNIALSLSGNNLLFYKYMSPVKIGTYSMPIGSSTPVLIEESQSNIREIIELKF